MNRTERLRNGRPARGPEPPVYLVLGIILVGSLFAMGAVPVAGLALLAASLALAAMLVVGRRRAAADLARAVERAAEQEVRSLFVDQLTGLANRRQLLEQLPLEVARAERYGQPLSLVTVEIPDLDYMRERWGMAMVDRAVLHVANALKRVAPDAQLIFRLEGGQFAVLCQEKRHPRRSRLCEGAALAIGNRPIMGGNRPLPLYVTVQTAAVDYEAGRFEGPLEFLSAAGCDIGVERRVTGGGNADARELRRRLVAGYAPEEAVSAGTVLQERKAV